MFVRLTLTSLLLAASLAPRVGAAAPEPSAETGAPAAASPGDQSKDENVTEIVVFGRASKLIGLAESGSEGLVGRQDLELRSIGRVGDLVEVVPGLIATQHSGPGKANQYFLRGFNLDHGTDFSVAFNGAPVNFRTHGHGQGYLDLNFLIPEITEEVAYRKGPYRVEDGDFAAAGSAEFRPYRRLGAPIVSATFGQGGFRRALLAGSRDFAGGSVLAAFETNFSDGLFVLPANLHKYNGFLQYSRESGGRSERFSLSGYRAAWTASDQIPLRAVESGLIPRLGFIDPNLGGETTRIAFTAQYQDARWTNSAYAEYYNFHLFSNFTYFLNDPLNGDEFEQADRRAVFGGESARHFQTALGSVPIDIELGGAFRYDDILGVGLFNTVARRRLSTTRDDSVREWSLAGYWRANFRLTQTLRGGLGLRADYFNATTRANLAANSGRADSFLLSPKAFLAWRIASPVELYFNYGEGFHSNDARGAVTRVDPATGDPATPVDLLVKARAAEIGARFERGPLTASVTGFWLDIGSELVFVGDAGTTEPNSASRRFGSELSLFLRPSAWAALDIAAAYTSARFFSAPAGERRVPQSVPVVLSADLTLLPVKNFSVFARLRRFAGAPLIEDGSVFAQPTQQVSLGAAYQVRKIRFKLDVLNLLNSRDTDISYFFESQLPGEAAPVSDIHFKPVEPRQIRGTIEYRF